MTGDKFFLCGGSNEDKSNGWLPSVYSKKTFKIDVVSGAMIRLADMNSKRQAHGLCKIGQYIYACGGLQSCEVALKSCERYDINKNTWSKDVPDMEEAKYSHTMIVVSNTWLYAFGGAYDLYFDDRTSQTVERFNTSSIKNNCDYNNNSKWEMIVMKSGHKTLCQQGVIQLSRQFDDDHVRYLIFGGIQTDY